MARLVFRKPYRRPLGYFLDMATILRLDAKCEALSEDRPHRMAIFANDHIGLRINTFGVYEKEVLELVFSFLAPLESRFAAGLALDIGANIGNHTLQFAPRFGEVHAFEPHPDTFELLQFNTRRSSNVKLHQLALGDRSGELTLVEHPTNIGRSAISSGADGAGTSITIPVATLDGMSIDRDRLCFIKVDVEGFEANVLNGALGTIRSAQPVIVLEQNDDCFVGGRSAAIELLRSLGYSFCWLADQASSRSWVMQRFVNLKELVAGGTHRLVAGDVVPRGSYPMLIAIPDGLKGQVNI